MNKSHSPIPVAGGRLMGLMESVIESYLDRMSSEEKIEIVERMMGKFMDSLTPEERREMVASMMPKMMEQFMSAMKPKEMGEMMASMMPAMMECMASEEFFEAMQDCCAQMGVRLEKEDTGDDGP